MYLSPVLMPLAGIIGSGQVVRPTATGWGVGGQWNVFGLVFILLLRFLCKHGLASGSDHLLCTNNSKCKQKTLHYIITIILYYNDDYYIII